MPNWITNRLTILGTPDQVESIFKRYNTYCPAKLLLTHDEKLIVCRKKDKEYSLGWFDPETAQFEKKEGNVTIVSIGLPKDWEFEITQAVNHFPDFDKIIPQPENIFNDNLGEEERELCKKEGRPNWYDWNIENWGTKWRCSHCQQEKHNVFLFDTAWNGVTNLMLEMSKQNQGVMFEYEFADEDTSYNCASYKILNGIITEAFEPEGGSNEAYELAFKLRPHEADYYKMIDGNYQYAE